MIYSNESLKLLKLRFKVPQLNDAGVGIVGQRAAQCMYKLKEERPNTLKNGGFGNDTNIL